MTSTIAFFDFDGTLTQGDTLVPFLRFLKGDWKFALAAFFASPSLSAYAVHCLDNQSAKEALLKQAIGNESHRWLQQQGEQFAREVIPDLLREEGIHRLHKHQAQGDSCVLVSASLDVYLQPWAESMGFDGCLCSSLEIKPDGYVSGKLFGKNCYGNEKVSRIQQWEADNACFEACKVAYGDSKGDWPMLQHASQGWLYRSGSFQLIDKFL
jgi:phosphatidylglycerophosphatase C